ncbi:hypothetical protein CHS0354_023775 [Potamilus streckersoni]|uniref:PASTA domain-containing protein n=1 Tax=Potamilus streckersoni TaxID=2493646 RepID=A0AAE0RZ26_9BIVA|nr:hypothetical protein CHS0354_023775 [Potamilus streckersoni]
MPNGETDVKKTELDSDKSRYSDEVVAQGKGKERLKGRLKTLKKNARERIESVLNLRTLIVIGLVTVFLGVYIYNVTSINRLGEEVRQKKELYEQLFSLVSEKKSKLEYLQRSENISSRARSPRSEYERKKDAQCKNRLILVLLIMSFALFGVIFRIFTVQILEGSVYKEKAQRQQIRVIEVKPARGDIIDREGEKLANSVRGYSFAVYLVFLNEIIESKIRSEGKQSSKISSLLALEKRRIATLFSKTFNKSEEYYLNKLKKNEKFIWLERYVPMLKSENVIAQKNKAIIAVKEEIRHYANMAGQVIGITNIDNKGVFGIEKRWDDVLRGEKGLYIYERAQKGRSRLSVEQNQIEPKKGGTVELTINMKMQEVLEGEIKQKVLKTGAQSGFGAIMNVNTGEIMGMGNYPFFDMHTRNNLTKETERNRMLTESLEPGSTFKLISLAVAIERGIVNPTDEVDCAGGEYKIYDRVVRDHEKLKKETFLYAFAKSSNIAIVKMSQHKLFTNDYFFKKIIDFGFNQKTNIDISGEVSGKVKPLSEWTGITKSWMSYGYEIQVTPIQLLAAYAAIANDGILMKPYIVKKISGIEGDVIHVGKPREVRRVVSKKVAKEIKAYLKAVVDSGTAQTAKIEGISVAGKTGTAQQYVMGSYKTGSYFSSFVGFFPVENPMYAIFIGIQNPTKGYYASYAAAPAFAEIGAKIVSVMRADEREILLSEQIQQNKEALYLDTASSVIVPDLRGLTEVEAKKLLRFHQLDYQKKDLKKALRNAEVEYVEAQGISVGTKVKIWTKVPIKLVQNEKMPNLKGFWVDRAVIVLNSLGVQSQLKNDGDIVKSQSQVAGTTISKNATCLLLLE